MGGGGGGGVCMSASGTEALTESRAPQACERREVWWYLSPGNFEKNRLSSTAFRAF